MTTIDKPLTGYWSRDIWAHYPATIAWIQSERDRRVSKQPHTKMDLLYNGINANIILLSACCIEGFLFECLNTYISKFSDKNKMTEKETELAQRVSSARFGDCRELFKEVTGKTIGEHLKDKPYIDGIKPLIDCRNGLAHGRPAVYLTYDPPQDEEQEYEIGSQYESVNDYLKKKKLILGQENFLNDRIADHFASLVEPYIKDVYALLPLENRKIMSIHLAFKEGTPKKFQAS